MNLRIVDSALSKPLLAACVLFVPAVRGRAAGLFGPEKGLVWMAGVPGTRSNQAADPKNTEKLVAAMDQVLTENPALTAVFLDAGWKFMEPEPGHYDWAALDADIAMAHKHGKAYKLCFHPGVGTPQWVYDQGAVAFPTTIQNKHADGFGSKIQIPLPWDRTYLKAFEGLLAKVSERYGNDRSFIALSLSGENFMSNEMHLPKTPADLKRWGQYPDARGKIVAVYKELIDTYAALFPHQQLALHISVPLPGMDNEVADIIRYGAEKHPDQFTLQNCQLDGRDDDSEMFSYKFITEYDGRLRHGFQVVSGWHYNGYPQGSVELTVFNLVHAHGEYLEVFPGDGADPELCARIMKLWDSARKMGWEAYEAQLKTEGKYIPPM